MPFGNLTIPLVTYARDSVDDELQVELSPLSNSVGGRFMRTSKFNSGESRSARIESISCADIGTHYRVLIWSGKYMPLGFAAVVRPGDQTAQAPMFLVDPGKVKGIDSPWERRPKALTDALEKADIPQNQKRGQELYDSLSALQKACLLNIYAKANSKPCAFVWPAIRVIRRIEQDRIFALVDSGLMQAAREAKERGDWTLESNALHEPMPGFQREASFKSRDDHANLQLTFMSNGPELAVDLDIDEARGAEHAIEVVRNTFRGKTSPYQIRELLIGYAEVDPDYRLRFEEAASATAPIAL